MVASSINKLRRSIRSFPARPAGFIPTDLCGGSVRFRKPVRTLVEETFPSVSGRPEKNADFQTRAVPSLRIERRAANFNALVFRPAQTPPDAFKRHEVDF
jgi:hypothetical protein